MLQKLSCFFLIFFIGGAAFAQRAILTGTVSTKEGQPLELATIALKGTTIGIQTDAKGNFSLNVPALEGITVVAQYIGYKKQEIKLRLATGETRNLNIALELDVKVLNKVTIRGR